MKLLLVEADTPIRRLINDDLTRHGVQVTSAGSSSTARTAIRHNAFDIAIVDLSLPDGSGVDLLQTLREDESRTHVIMLSGALAEVDCVGALDLGADDYVLKPFLVRELVARVMAVRRRRSIGRDRILRRGALTFDLAARQVTRHDELLSLTVKEFDLLAFLAARPHHVFSRDELLRSVWQSGSDWQQAATVTEHVRRLRLKIEPDPLVPTMLQTVRGQGYRFDTPPTESEGPTGGTPPGVHDAVIVYVDGHIVLADDASAALIGAESADALVGLDIFEFVAPRSLSAARNRGETSASSHWPSSQLLVLQRVDGTETSVEFTSSPMEWNGLAASRAVIRPISDPPALLRRLATGVLSEVSDAIIVTDLGFHVRSWNRAAERLYGWSEEDVLGRHILDALQWAADESDLTSSWHALELQGRWHGEGRFVARDGSTAAVLATMTRLQGQHGDPSVIVAVHRAKSTASPGARTDPATHSPGDLRRGLDAAEFEVFYQPVLRLGDLTTVCVEALIRWNHPRQGCLEPGAFLDALVHSEMVGELGHLVLNDACCQTARWRRGADVEVAVNLSAIELANPALVDEVTAALAVSGLDASALWLEVTESALIEDVDQAARTLHRLAALGIRIAIDDFGTGWASLTYLKQFPVHALKIDRTFVAGIEHDPRDIAIARSVIALGNELDLQVIAEGIETPGQQAALEALGCTMGQGFLYARPSAAHLVPVDRFRADLSASVAT